MKHKCAELFCPGSFGVSFSVLSRVSASPFHPFSRARFPLPCPRSARETGGTTRRPAQLPSVKYLIRKCRGLFVSARR